MSFDMWFNVSLKITVVSKSFRAHTAWQFGGLLVRLNVSEKGMASRHHFMTCSACVTLRGMSSIMEIQFLLTGKLLITLRTFKNLYRSVPPLRLSACNSECLCPHPRGCGKLAVFAEEKVFLHLNILGEMLLIRELIFLQGFHQFALTMS